MRRRNWTMAAGLSAALLATLSANVSAQTSTKARAPFIHIYSRAGQAISNYVEPSIEVGEDAYVFAVSIDLDGQIQVLHPEYAGLSVRLRPHRELQLKNFFAGSGRAASVYSGGGSYNNYDAGYVDDDTRGVIIALASRAPFNFDPIYAGNDWNFAAIRNLIEGRPPTVAARNLAQQIGASGEPIGRDFMRFATARDYRYAYVPEAFLSQCDLAYAYGLGANSAASQQRTLNQIAYLRSKGQNVSVVGYDVCGRPIVAYVPVGPGSPRLPTGRIPHGFPRDTTVFPKTQGNPATGAFPLTRGAGTIPSAYPGATISEERPTDPRVIRREPRRAAEPQSVPAEPAYAAPARIPRVERMPAPAENPSAPRHDPGVINEPAPRVINEPAQGSFGSSHGRVETPAPQPRVIEAPVPVHREQPVQRAEPVQREAPPPRSAPAPSKTEPTTPPPHTN